jgi:hypothetical protein
MVMSVYNNNKQETKDIKQYIKPQQANKLVNPKEKVGDKSGRTLPTRGQ